MKIAHVAIWVGDLERMRDFYMKYFNMKSGEKYINAKNSFSSYFLSFEGASTQIEIMHSPDIVEFDGKQSTSIGLTHFSLSVGGRKKVDELTEILRKDGFVVVGEPRTTGDGYYESVVKDCEGNLVEIAE